MEDCETNKQKLKNIIMKEHRRLKIGYYGELMSASKNLQIDAEEGNLANVRGLEEVMRAVRVRTRNREKWKAVRMARESQSRLLYSSLTYSPKYITTDTLSLDEKQWICRARLEMLGFGHQPYLDIKNECEVCNSKVREDTLHIVGKCPAYDEVREDYLGKQRLCLEQVREVLDRGEQCLAQYVSIVAELRRENLGTVDARGQTL